MSQEREIEAASEAPRGIASGAPAWREGRTQREVLLHVLRIAAQYETWVSLEELAGKTRFPQASISAQLRHLRKKEYGGWKVERRRREWERDKVVWEYRLGV